MINIKKIIWLALVMLPNVTFAQTGLEQLAEVSSDKAGSASTINGAALSAALNEALGNGVDQNISVLSKIWITNKTKAVGGFGIQSLEQGKLHNITGAGEQIASDQNDNPWTVNSTGKIWYYSNNSWQKMSGAAKDISSGGGKVWVVGTTVMTGGYALYERIGNSWKHHNIGAVRLDVDSAGQPWIVNSANDVFHYQNGKLQNYPGIKAKDIGSGGGQTWAISTNEGIYKLVGTSWKKMPGAATRVDVDAQGSSIVVNRAGEVFSWGDNKWTKLAATASDVAVKNTK
jgi:hypothetical protein